MKRFLLCMALVAWSGMASAVVYKWVDAQGKVQYGDRPPDGVHAEIVPLLVSHGTPPAPAPETTPRSTSPTPPPKIPPHSATGDDAKQAVDEDVAQTREKQCADAQSRYKKLIEGRRMYKAGADGERQYMTSEEIDAERQSAKQEVDTACNSPD